MKKIKFYHLAILLLSMSYSCSNIPTVIESRDVTYTTIIEDIEVQMPGNLYISDKNYIVEDPMNRLTMFIAYNRDSKSYVDDFCKRGNAQTEIMQAYSIFDGSNILVFDLNSPKYIRFSANEIGKIEDYGKSTITNQMHTFCSIDENHLVGVEMNKKDDFISYCTISDKLDSIGSLPVGDVNYTNSVNANRGNLNYNRKSSTLFFTSTAMPLYHKYRVKNSKIELIESKVYDNYTYNIEDGKIKFDFDRTKLTKIDLLTDKYIIQIKKTPSELAESSEKKRGLDFSGLPKHLYIYDHDFNLLKILNTNTPIVRIAEDKKSGKLHMINYRDGMFDLSIVNFNL